MSALTFILLLLIAAAAAGAHTLIGGWMVPLGGGGGPGRSFAARFVAYAMLLTLPALLPRLLGG